MSLKLNTEKNKLWKNFCHKIENRQSIWNFNTLIFVSSTYRVYFIIFFLKSAVFTIKKEPFPSPEKNGLLFIILETDD